MLKPPTNVATASAASVPPQSPAPATEIDRLEQTARRLAAELVMPDQGQVRQFPLLRRSAEYARRLQAAYQHFSHLADDELAYLPVAEWFLDNYYVLRQTIRQIEEDLPQHYYQQLPSLGSAGEYRSYPRVYALAREVVLLEQAQLDLPRIERFARVYQETQPLTMGEVWAWPTMFRLTLLEALIQTLGHPANPAAEEETLDPALRFSFDAGQGDIVANIVVSLRLLAGHDWRAFFETVNLAEQALRQDPAGLYARQEFQTRDQYRKVVEELARTTGRDEVTVAWAAVRLAADCQPGLDPTPGPDGRAAEVAEARWQGLALARHCHVGFYLLAEGRQHLEQQIGYRPGVRRRFQRWLGDRAVFVYLASLAGLTLAVIAVLLAFGLAAGGALWQLALLALLGLVPASVVSVSLVNWAVTYLVPPRVLPKLDFRKGLPPSCQTMVVIPTLLANTEEVVALLRQLELHYLHNPDPNLGFVLLTDFVDAPQESLPQDEALLAQADEGVHILNERYPGQPFFLFHRRRQWNPHEGTWMGWERKRGKLHEFNQLLRGAEDTSFVKQMGRRDVLPKVKYVITLDADTVLPANAAPRLVGTLAHPLNRAVFDDGTDEVVAGYTVLQPRTEIRPRSAQHSLFTRVFAGDSGLDLYSLAVSNVYQDLFGEGIYMGKGIYDVDAFERSLAGRIPENSLLSHDLLEGLCGRAGLVSDIVLYEEYPSHYLIKVRRSHRWIRGDWQLLPWLLASAGLPKSTASPTGARLQKALSPLDRWKIADNLRRSLAAPSLLLFLVAGWLLWPGRPLTWTVISLLLPALALSTGPVVTLWRGVGRASWREARRSARDSTLRWLLQIVFLPYEALLALDAIFITLWRLFISRRDLLQWTTTAHTARLFGSELSTETTTRHMIPSILLTLIIALLLIIFNRPALPVATPLMVAWLLAARIAHRISQPDPPTIRELTGAERQRLRVLARRTWLFFEQTVRPGDNWLPPDHFQEVPLGRLAHRTSPTNIGLYLLSALAAYDLGYISALTLPLRLRSTFETLAQLEKYRGHFLNWLDTETLQPLPPRYVSTVDSGNLAACLLVVKQGCLAVPQEPLLRWQRWQGVLDLLALLQEALDASHSSVGPAGAEPDSEQRMAVKDQLSEMPRQILAVQDNPAAWPALVLHLAKEEQPELERRLVRLVEAEQAVLEADAVHNLRLYAECLRRDIHAIERQWDLLLAWLPALQRPPVWFTRPDAAPALRDAWAALQVTLSGTPSLEEVGRLCWRAETPLRQLEMLAAAEPANWDLAAESSGDPAAAREWCANLLANLAETRATAETLLADYAWLARQADECVAAMDFTFLFNQQRQVFHIGYNVDRAQLDANFYDLLASEARLTSIVAIAKRDAPVSHWLHLARPLTRLDEGLALLSWSGTMFEYLLPPQFMSSYAGTLLAETADAVVRHQVNYGREHHVPWGISESGFYEFDNAQNYQYRAFGLPELGYKRGLAEDLVVTPYASLLALAAQPQKVLSNLDHLQEYQMVGRFGLYEALDFTASRLALGQKAAAVRAYMAHHQGMILLSLDNYLQGEAMIRRFQAEPAIQSVALLLQEQVPAAAPLETPRDSDDDRPIRPEKTAFVSMPWSVPAATPLPLAHFLSNGRFGSLITNAGSGYLCDPEVAYTRWQPDATLDDCGLWLYVQDADSGALWSAGRQPTCAAPRHEEVTFSPHMVRFSRRDQDIALQVEITVAPDADVEIRRLSLTNDTDRQRRLRLTSYGEVVLDDLAAANRHPAFSKLFVESQYVPEFNLLLFRRRPRSAEEAPRFLGHMLVLASPQGRPAGAFESDRARFLGRNGLAAQPQALMAREWLSGTAGATLDPIMALGQYLRLQPHASVELALVTFTASSRAGLLRLAGEYQRWATIQRAFVQAHTQAEQELRQLNMPAEALEQTQRLLSLLFYPHPALRADPTILAANHKGQDGLWAHGISGDYPLLLVRLGDESSAELLHFLLRAHKFWRRRGLKIDLVIMNEQESVYDPALQGFIYRLIQRHESAQWLNRRGGLFVLRRDQLSQEDEILLHTAARVVLDGGAGSLARQLAHLLESPPTLPGFVPSPPAGTPDEPLPPIPRPADLQFDNGYGGFSADGREYVIYCEPGQTTPAPWINVVANPDFGFLISESGGGYSWAGNSGENRLTPWRNDSVTDAPAEALYLRDEETAEIWTPTPQPAGAATPYLVRHGAGYTLFEHHSHLLEQRLRLFVAPDAPLKIVQLRLENATGRPRRITATYYAEWVLGSRRELTQSHIIPSYHPALQALLARNPYNADYGTAVAFVAASKELHGLTADRTEFLGRLGSLRHPAALDRIGLQGRVQAGLDPCAALQLHLDLPPWGSEEITFLIGQGSNEEEALAIIKRFQDATEVEAAWQAVHCYWDETLGSVSVSTPDPALNLLFNRWLLYQTLAGRLWARSALYQSSGAYGFRDQLQDVLALLPTRPDLARAHILRAAGRQFAAGDVLHWWHPPSARGVRTRIADDMAWLPFATAHYVETTGDRTILDDEVPFLTGQPLAAHEHESYDQYEAGPEGYSLYEHCCRALKRAATSGRHGLPLIGAGDWNDGLNRVGAEGLGESVWLGWFLADTLNRFARLVQERGDGQLAATYRQQAEAYRQAIEEHAWDGEWYRRAYYDDGTPLGSAQNQEAQIDAIAQAWGVLSGLADQQRAQTALAAVHRRLVDEAAGLILLLAPPFDKTTRDPGYIKGYPPGIRENGAQYTHAAIWTTWAFAELGQGDLAGSLLRLLNPIYRTDTPEKAATYQVEPYVIAADIYSVPPQRGRGGWTWYTGSAGWLHRLILEGILGLRRQGATVLLDPCIPRDWPEYCLTYCYGHSVYEIVVKNPAGVNQGVKQITLDGRALPEDRLALLDDGNRHLVEVLLG